MKPRNNPTDAQLLDRMRREPIHGKDRRVKNDAYWALRHQGYSHAYAKRAFRDVLPRYYQEELALSGEYIDDMDPEDLLYVPEEMGTTITKLAVLVRPDYTAEDIENAPPRAKEYTIPSDNVPDLGVRVRPSGHKSYIFCFRVRNRKAQGRITLGKLSEISFEDAQALAVQMRYEARRGRDPRPMHKSGEFWRRIGRE